MTGVGDVLTVMNSRLLPHRFETVQMPQHADERPTPRQRNNDTHFNSVSPAKAHIFQLTAETVYTKRRFFKSSRKKTKSELTFSCELVYQVNPDQSSSSWETMCCRGYLRSRPAHFAHKVNKCDKNKNKVLFFWLCFYRYSTPVFSFCPTNSNLEDIVHHLCLDFSLASGTLGGCYLCVVIRAASPRRSGKGCGTIPCCSALSQRSELEPLSYAASTNLSAWAAPLLADGEAEQPMIVELKSDRQLEQGRFFRVGGEYLMPKFSRRLALCFLVCCGEIVYEY